MTPQQALQQIIAHQEISHDEMVVLMRQIMQGEVSPVLIAGLVIGLRVKTETVEEIAAAAHVMRELATRVAIEDDSYLVDTCGTGGDAAHTFNISTAAAFVAAAAGARVAKHGGRSVSSRSGSADVLEALGVNLDQAPQQVASSINDIGVGFMFAPHYHAAMKHAAPVRRELGVRTIFNILGPLTNPANARRQVLGVFSGDLVLTLAHVLHKLGSQHVMIVHGEDGLDEITISGATRVGELKNGKVHDYFIRPEDFQLKTTGIESLRVNDCEQAKSMLLSVLENAPGPARDIVLLNAGAAIYVAGKAETLAQGVDKAAQAIESGAALGKLRQLIEFTHKNGGET